MKTDMAAVITGDINASRGLDEQSRRQLEHVLTECFMEIQKAMSIARIAGFTSFRGDAWQFVVGEPSLSVRAALFYRALLLYRSEEKTGKKLQTSAAIGFGDIRFMPDERSSAGSGEAYELSGRRLDTLRRRMPQMGAAGLGELDGCLDSILGLFDALAHQWTALQARAVSLALQDLSQTEIATRWNPPVSQQAIFKHLRSAGWQAMEPALKWAETAIKGCNQDNNSKGF